VLFYRRGGVGAFLFALKKVNKKNKNKIDLGDLK
jgi:hypothetical protein